MKILHVITSLSRGGAEGVVASLVPQLAKHDARCGVMPIYPTSIPASISSAREIDVLEINRRGRYDPTFLPRMISQIRAWRPDVVHTHMFVASYWGRLAAIAAGVPVIVRTEHAPCSQERVAGALLGSKMLNVATASIVTFFPEQGRLLRQKEGFAPSKLAIIPNGIVHSPIPIEGDVTRARSKLGAADGTYAIIVLGSMYGPKNPTLAISAIAALDAVHRARGHLYFLGDGPDRPHVEALARELGVDANVSFLGYRTDVRELLPGADLLLMPSLTEGMPLAMIEAMSAGVPVLSTPWPGVGDMLRSGTLGTIAGDYEPATIAACIRQMMDDETSAHSIARSAQTVVRADYDVDRIAVRHRELYDTLVFARRVA